MVYTHTAQFLDPCCFDLVFQSSLTKDETKIKPKKFSPHQESSDMIVLFFPDNMAATMATWRFCAAGQGWQRWREWLVRKRDSLCILERPVESFHPAFKSRRHLTKKRRSLNTGILHVWGGMGEVTSTFNNRSRSGSHYYRENMTFNVANRKTMWIKPHIRELFQGSTQSAPR